jgi:hypothetical protein
MKNKLIVGLVVALLVFGIQMSFVANSFPGFHSNGDCNICHNFAANAYNSSYETFNVKVDGILDEAIWAEDATYGRRNMVPVASTFGSAHEYITVYMGQNSTHIFLAASWADPTIDGTDTQAYADSDGIAFMFNINVTNFDTGYGMDRAPDNTAVDMFTWKPGASETGNEVFMKDYVPKSITDDHFYDQYIYDDSRKDDKVATDWTHAAVHGNVSSHSEGNYQIEMARPLVNTDPNDVQFDKTRYYQFGLVIYNNTSGSKHWISPVMSVFVWNPSDSNPNVATITRDKTAYITETEVKTEVSTETAAAPITFFPLMAALVAIPILKRKFT